MNEEEKKPEVVKPKINIQQKLNLIDELVNVRNIAIVFKGLVILLGIWLILKLIIKM